jgi:PhzF family phenazine biosynthesis protein
VKLTLYQVDAFTSDVFRGNPAAVVPLERWLDDPRMQAIAAENNLAETAFFVREPAGFRIRWFTPEVEVDLCGHATLASAWVYFRRLEPTASAITFASRSGPLTVTREGERLVLDFPALPPEPWVAGPDLFEALGGDPKLTLRAMDAMVVYETEDEVRALKPDLVALREVDTRGVIVTAPGRDVDFVSRFFAPRVGVPEDPVTGSAHCMLIPYWAERLGRTKLHARQISKRGGELWCELAGNRVKIAGHGALYLTGTIEVE